MKVQKGNTTDIGDALNSLHLSNPLRKKRRRLSGINGEIIPTLMSEENILPVDNTNEEPEHIVRKSNRKKTVPVRWNPQNYEASGSHSSRESNPSDIKNYYLNQEVNKKSTALETIHEVPDSSNKFMGNRKFRRFLQFDRVTKCKIKKRKHNAQKFKLKKTIKATIDDLHRKLNLIEEEDC